MRISEGVESAIHCCTLLAVLPHGSALPASRLAEYHGVPGAYLAKHLQALARAGVVESGQGPRGGYRLSRPPAEINLLEIVEAVEGTEPAFTCKEIRRRGPAAIPANGYPKPCGIARAMWRAEEAWRQSLRETTLADLLIGLAVDIDPRAVTKAANWFQEVLR